MAWKKYRKPLSVIIFLSILGGVYFFVTEKMIPGIETSRKQFQETLAIQEYQTERLKNIQRAKEDFEIVEKAEKVLPPFLDKNNGVEFIREVERLSEGKNSRVAIEVAPVEAPAKGKKDTKSSKDVIMDNLPSKNYLYFKIKTAGSFLGLIKFINQLESSKYYLDIVSLQINVNQEAGVNKKAESQEKGNPFSPAGKNGVAAEEKIVENEEEVIGLVSVVVYTQN